MTVAINGNGTITGSDIVGAAALNAAVAAAINSAPVFRMVLSADHALTDGTATKVLLNSVAFDTAAGWVSGSNRYLPNKAGYYQVNFKTTTNSASSNQSNGYSMLYKNGAEYSRGNQFVMTSTMSYWGSNGSCVVYLNGTTDYIELYAMSDVTSGATTATASATLTYLDGFFIHA